jgi:hypothetical protein
MPLHRAGLAVANRRHDFPPPDDHESMLINASYLPAGLLRNSVGIPADATS